MSGDSCLASFAITAFKAPVTSNCHPRVSYYGVPEADTMTYYQVKIQIASNQNKTDPNL